MVATPMAQVKTALTRQLVSSGNAALQHALFAESRNLLRKFWLHPSLISQGDASGRGGVLTGAGYAATTNGYVVTGSSSFGSDIPEAMSMTLTMIARPWQNTNTKSEAILGSTIPSSNDRGFNLGIIEDVAGAGNYSRPQARVWRMRQSTGVAYSYDLVSSVGPAYADRVNYTWLALVIDAAAGLVSLYAPRLNGWTPVATSADTATDKLSTRNIVAGDGNPLTFTFGSGVAAEAVMGGAWAEARPLADGVGVTGLQTEYANDNALFMAVSGITAGC